MKKLFVVVVSVVIMFATVVSFAFRLEENYQKMVEKRSERIELILNS